MWWGGGGVFKLLLLLFYQSLDTSNVLVVVHVDGIGNKVKIYTERQKKLITSSGRRSLKSTLSKLIRISEKHKIFSCQKEKNVVKSRKVIFRKSQKLLTERALSELHGGSLFRTFNSYSFNFNGGLRKTPYRLLSASNSQPERQAVSVIFKNLPLAISSHLSPF